jgi:hypothetical protein
MPDYAPAPAPSDEVFVPRAGTGTETDFDPREIETLFPPDPFGGIFSEGPKNTLGVDLSAATDDAPALGGVAPGPGAIFPTVNMAKMCHPPDEVPDIDYKGQGASGTVDNSNWFTDLF